MQSRIKADIAISYSSFEHDGLGRYGDPLDPDGDLRAMKEAHDSLNDDGVLLLGIPMGQDLLCWNANRVYGKLRLPVLLKGWHCIDVFDANKGNTVGYPFDFPLGAELQCLLVCRKILTDYPDAEILEKQARGEGVSTGTSDKGTQRKSTVQPLFVLTKINRNFSG